MKYYLSDAGGAGLIFFVYGVIVLFIVLAILLEAAVMIAMKYNIRFKKAALDSTIINVASLVVGFILLEYFEDFITSYTPLNFLILYIITVVIESWLLYLLNKTKPFKQTLKVTLVMNLISYLLLFFMTRIGE